MLRVWCLGFAGFLLVPRILCCCFWLAARLCVKRLVLPVWCLGFAVLVGCAQDCVLLFLLAARLCVKRLVLRGLVFTQDLVLLCLVGCKALCEELGA